MKYTAYLLLMLLPFFADAQGASEINFFMRDVNGRILDGINNSYKVEGSPYLMKTFCNASIVSARGTRYTKIPANINLETNQLIFQTPDNQKMAVNIAVSRVVFDECETNEQRIFLSGFSPVDRLTEKNFYQLLDSGSVLLLKSFQANYSESRGYSESVPTRTYEQTTAYYVFLPAQGMVKVPRSITDVPGVLEKEKKDKLTNYIRTHQLKSRNEADLIKLMAYYNSL